MCSHFECILLCYNIKKRQLVRDCVGSLELALKKTEKMMVVKLLASICQVSAKHFAKHSQAQSACLSLGTTWVQLG